MRPAGNKQRRLHEKLVQQQQPSGDYVDRGSNVLPASEPLCVINHFTPIYETNIPPEVISKSSQSNFYCIYSCAFFSQGQMETMQERSVKLSAT